MIISGSFEREMGSHILNQRRNELVLRNNDAYFAIFLLSNPQFLNASNILLFSYWFLMKQKYPQNACNKYINAL